MSIVYSLEVVYSQRRHADSACVKLNLTSLQARSQQWGRVGPGPPTEGRSPPAEVGPHFHKGAKSQGTNTFRLEFINQSLNFKMYSLVPKNQTYFYSYHLFIFR